MEAERVTSTQAATPRPLERFPDESPLYSRRRFLGRMGAVAAGTISTRIAGLPPIAMTAASPFPRTSSFSADVPTAWFDLAMALVKETTGFSPPVASRAFLFTGLTLYEAVVPGMPGHRSLSGQLSALTSMPSTGKNRAFHWPTVANSALAAIMRGLFPTASDINAARMEGLETRFSDQFKARLPLGMFNRSAERGKAVASVFFDWSKVDGGHEGYLRNSPTEYVPPVGPGLWVRTPPSFLPALQPFWGSNRTCVVASGAACPPGDHTPYSEDPASQFFAEALEVFEAVNNLTPEQQAIALFWSDEPGTTTTPPGHSVSMTTQVLRHLGSGLDVAAEAYARVGLALGDAFISCWNAKYRYNLLRPVTYIQSHIDPAWISPLTTPPFPEYTSGHSVQSGAWAHVMTDMFGEVAFTDHTHADRGLEARSFSSFFEAADEAAISRLYGGIHYRPAVELGVDQGRCIGKAIGALQFHG